MAKLDPEVLAHLEWIGFVRPTGLVVSAPALVRAGANLDRSDAESQRLLRAAVVDRTFSDKEAPAPFLPDFVTFARSVLGWSFSPNGYAGTEEGPIPAELEIARDGDTFRPDFAVRERDPQSERSSWQLLVRVLDAGEDFDRVSRGKGQIEASEHGRMERLLRQTRVPAGLLFNGRAIRILSAPYGESSGWVDFKVADMVQTAGRPITTAMRLLLNEQRLLSLPRAQRLAALLDDSRKFQNEVSERLAEQVLHALYELLRGFQHANDQSKGDLLRYTLADHPDEVYRGLLTVLLRLVFLLYAEERDMLPEDETYLRNYSLAGLYERLREDAALYPDTMEQRYGAWAQLLALFRMIHDGADAGAMRLPKRHGVLFDPDRYPFLEGRFGAARQIHERIEPPLVPDGTIWRALQKLLVLDGERISYRALGVENIGSVYETMMGFRLERTMGPSIAIKAQKRNGAPTAIDLEALLAQSAEKREKWIAERADRKLTENVKRAVKAATTLEDLHDALSAVVDRHATPDLVPGGAMVLQPSEERRRSGSHYTPTTLTKPIVETTLEPILKRLRGKDDRPPTPEQILDLKVCDPAMGSGAFLVETCRQLGAALVESWRFHDAMPPIPFDEDEVVFAQRLVAQRCLYGVDKNPVAVDLAKVSLWLVTLAREHALTFVDHALRHGDSLVGLSRKQIEAFHWDETAPEFQKGFEAMHVREHLDRVSVLRKQIREAGESVTDRELREWWHAAQAELGRVRLFADLTVTAFFESESARDREDRRRGYAKAVLDGMVEQHGERLEEWRRAEPPLVPFHWQIEFPEVFGRHNPGFDAIVGNPPFAGKNSVASSNPAGYPDWLKQCHQESHGNADLVAHFFRRAFDLLRERSTLGLIATNTIAQGDTRSTGLRWICQHGGEIYSARKHVKWPGLAAVVVSVLHVQKGILRDQKMLDDREVETITAFLFHRGGHDDPTRLGANAGKSFQGSIVLGMGFTFDDTDSKGAATPLNEMRRLIEARQANREVIFPYIGGEEVNNSPTHEHHRFVIDFGERSELECRRLWPELIAIAEQRVKPSRVDARGSRRERWWQHAEKSVGLYASLSGLKRALAINCGATPHMAFAFLEPTKVFANTLDVFPLPSYAAFCALQSRPHEIWARFFGSSLEDRLRYTPSDCFETFPFPENWQTHPTLEVAGKEYYEFRAALMVRNDEGLTKTYNRFHDPDKRDADIRKLRELHAAMDRAVLDAYGCSDIPTDCEFLLDYEIDAEEWGNKKKPYRYRWPDDVRDEVLARLLELNAQRAAEEARSGVAVTKRAKAQTTKAVAAQPIESADGGRAARDRHFRRVVLSAEIVHQLHDEPTFGRVKHQKIFHLCEYIAELSEIQGDYHRDAAGPLDNRLIFANEKDLKKLKWYEPHEQKVGHNYRPLAKAGDHRKYLESYWPDKIPTIRRLIDLMRRWDTEGCEIFSTAYAVWNDFLLAGRDVSDDAIVDEVISNWHPSKRRIPERRWRDVLAWMRTEGFVPTGFGKPTKIIDKRKPVSKKKGGTGGTGELF
ncbi:MAG TPA: DNA methyltransferase [Gemmatimonadaceae bacterium]|jgi:hypothetical protein|nr:DNA methyltransferase [Gemmatimonadaceae bacterium]